MPHALINMIMALGEVCEYRRLSELSSKSTKLNMSQAEDEPRCSTLSTVAGISHSPPPNRADSRVYSPGQLFYERATRIMGTNLDGNDLIHAQVALLAGLYKGLIDQHLESMNWIYTADRVIQNLLRRWNLVGRSSLSKDDLEYQNNNECYPQSERSLRTRNLIVITAWICIQLESNMQLPTNDSPVGLLVYKDILPLPCYEPTTKIDHAILKSASRGVKGSNDEVILMHYTAHLTLEREIDHIQQHCNSDRYLRLSPEQLCRVLRNNRKALNNWRISLPDALQWSDDNPPLDDTMSAKLRAEYYNAVVSICRPYLDYALHIKPYATVTGDIHVLAVDSSGCPRAKAESYMFQVIRKMPDPEVSDAVRCCLDAAFHSAHTISGISCEPILSELAWLGSAYVSHWLHSEPKH